MRISRSHAPTRMSGIFLLAATAVATLSLQGAGAGAAGTPQGTVTAVMHLDHLTMRPGPPDWGVVVVTNRSGRVLHIHGCANRGGLVAGLVSSRVTYNPSPPLRGCHQVTTIGAGATTFRTWVATTYQNCGIRGQPACTGFGLSDLPPGTYHVRFPLAGLPMTTDVVLPARVTVLAPAWLASLRGSQGSLLVYASPCIGVFMSGEQPRVTVAVDRHGRLVARRSARGGATFTFALLPGHYVVRSSAHRRADVIVRTRRQTVANLASLCM
jgi:hypothetical protein